MKPRHYRVIWQRPVQLADGSYVTPFSDYPWWSALWDVLLTLAGLQCVELIRWLIS